MSPVCFVTERLFPVDSIDDWALELSWRARDAATAGAKVVVLWSTLAQLEAALLEQARRYYAAFGAELVVKEDIAPFGEPDEPLQRSSGGTNGLLAAAALRKLHGERKFARIEIAAERGLAFRVVQAQQTGLAFTDTELIVVLGNFGEWQRHQQMRLAVRPQEIRQDFMERESVELAEIAVTIQPEKVEFARELGWAPDRLHTRTAAHPPDIETREIGPRRIACYFGDPDDDPGFEHFRLLVEAKTGLGGWLFVEESHNRNSTQARRKQLEAAAKNSSSKLGLVLNPVWESFATLLRDQQAFAILSQATVGPRLRWLLHESIPFVFPEALLSTLPVEWRTDASKLAYAPRDPRSLLAAVRYARGFAQWTQLIGAWKDSLSTSTIGAALSTAPRDPKPVTSTELPRVTIAVSHYNLKQLLSETLECLAAQTYQACDVVVVDDGSDDPESLQAWAACQARFPSFSFVELPHRGYWSPRNHAITQCTNPFVIIVDGDNLPRPEMAEVFVRAMQRNPSFAAFTSYIAAFSEERAAALRGEFQALNAPLGGDPVSGYFQNIFGDTNSIFRTEALQAIHGFREDFRCAFGDWELFHRLVGHGHRLGVIPKVLLHYRRRAGGMIRQRTLYREHWEFFHTLDALATLRPADQRRMNRALHGLALNP